MPLTPTLTDPLVVDERSFTSAIRLVRWFGREIARVYGALSESDEGRDNRLLVEWILDGVPLATVMPRFNGQLTEEEVRSVVAFIKTMWSEEQREFQFEGSLRYEAQVREIAAAN